MQTSRSTSCKADWQKGPDGLSVLQDNKLTMSQEYALEAKMASSILDGMRKTTAGRWSQVNFVLICVEIVSGVLQPQGQGQKHTGAHLMKEHEDLKKHEDYPWIGAFDIQEDTEKAEIVSSLGKRRLGRI